MSDLNKKIEQLTNLLDESTPEIVLWTQATVFVRVGKRKVNSIAILLPQSDIVGVSDCEDGTTDEEIAEARRIANETTWEPLMNLPEGVEWIS